MYYDWKLQSPRKLFPYSYTYVKICKFLVAKVHTSNHEDDYIIITLLFILEIIYTGLVISPNYLARKFLGCNRADVTRKSYFCA